MKKYRRDASTKRSAFETAMDRVADELFPRNNRRRMRAIGGAARPAKPRRQDFALEVLEPRLLLSGDITAAIQTATLNGLDSLVVFADAIDAAPALQVKIPGVDKSLNQLFDLSTTLQNDLVNPIFNYFNGSGADPTPTVTELTAALAPSFGATSTFNASGDFEITLDLEERAV